MKLATINYSPEQKVNVLCELQDELMAVVERFVETHGEMPAVAVLGVLRLVETNYIARI